MTWTRTRSSRPPSASGHDERGFTPLETLVAFAVLAIGLGLVSMGIATATRLEVRTQGSAATLLFAQSRLEAAGIAEPLVSGQKEGRVDRKYWWRQTVQEVRPAAETANAPADQAGSSPKGPRTFWVSVVVGAADGTTTRLSALKVSSRATP